MAQPRQVVVIGNPGNRRIELFQAALRGLDLPAAQVVAYHDLLVGRVQLADVVAPGALVRIESPGKEWEVERALLLLGATDDEGYACLSRAEIEVLPFERGRILPSRQWYRGWYTLLEQIAHQLAACPPHHVMMPPSEIAAMFDKPMCHRRFVQAGLPVPRSLGDIRSYDELLDTMMAQRCARVFVKLAHGSSASGVVAYQTKGVEHHATTTVEMVQQNGELRLYNSRRIRVYRDQREIALLIDALCRERVQVEQWLPKAGIADQSFDLRVMVIGGQVCHVVARLSRSPMTNLHLLNARGDAAAVQARMGASAWAELCQSAQRATACFPGSLYAGLDILVAPDFRRHAILEINAFGDLLPGVAWSGHDTYTTEMLALSPAAIQHTYA